MSREQTLDASGRPHLTQRDLALRWGKAEATIARYRSDGVGPRFLKIGGAVLYRQEDVERFELENLFDSSSSRSEETECDTATCQPAASAYLQGVAA
ncbi:DNA-binding protein (plasmid) [Ralstonia solanacearum]|uniref:DNA-binding protein n=1 Tax=Ralstonia pseudosolanacearum TaxID=1310165 RepID=A0A454TI84_9RALS|nr:DNA-binding protein [Ralstonia pseudosolanacearum]MCK4135708.1 DNA-binding protein [Ralstonia pseudosolanacearum]QWF63622.1 DNA-binding protein [Ralstonia solanacearum]RAA04628.1 DNA-binding protein [Ralstonia pseudosolanacearum]RNL98854.1 DNA-binding protein [Ralstonia pseudosolanacearum]